MPSRRGYPRSHHGCQNCKTRRVKCDEHVPSCFRCQKRGESCSFLQVQASSAAGNSSSGGTRLTAQYSGALQRLQNRWRVDYMSEWIQYQPSQPLHPPVNEDVIRDGSHSQVLADEAHHSGTSHATPSNIASSCDTESPGESTSPSSNSGNTSRCLDLDPLDQVLFDHYVTSTHRTFSEDERIIKLFGSLVPKIAPAHPFLMRSLLAAAGSHCLSTVSTVDGALIAKENSFVLQERTLRHQSEALQLYARQFSTVDLARASDEYSMALCMTCPFILLFSIDGASGRQMTQRSHDGWALDKAVEFLRLQAGIAAIYRACEGQIVPSDLAFLLSYTPWSARDGSPPKKTSEQLQLDRLEELFALSSLDDPMRQLYLTALAHLRSVYHAISEEPRAVGPRMGWLTDKDALDLASCIEGRQPEALLLLAHWGASLDPWPGAWWDSGFAKVMLRDIRQELPAKYSEYMDWIDQR